MYDAVYMQSLVNYQAGVIFNSAMHVLSIYVYCFVNVMNFARKIIDI